MSTGARNQAAGAAFEDAVIHLAQLSGWRVAHFRAARTARGWRTPVSADGKGFPDLVLVRGDRAIFAECKAGTTPRLSADQRAWRDALRAADQEWHMFSGQDWPAIKQALTKGAE